MTHEQYMESAAPYALGALDPAERATFEAHLAGCAECREAIAAYREVAGALAQSAPPVVPRNAAALRDRIVRNAQRVRPIGVVLRPSRNGGQPRGVASSVTGAASRRVPWVIAALSLAAAAMFAFVYRAERNRAVGLRSELASARAARAHDDSVLAAFVGPEVHVVSLAAASEKPTVRVFWNHTRNTFIVTASGLPPAPAGKTYQLWALRKGQVPLPMGTFVANPAGQTMTTLAVSTAINDGGFIDDCALTIEPIGGSPQPTESPRLIGSWRHVD